MLSYERDAVIRAFLGNVGGQRYEDALYDLRAFYPSNTGTYFVPGSDHTFLLSDVFYNTSVEGVPLTSWVGGVVNGAATDLPVTPSLVLAQGE